MTHIINQHPLEVTTNLIREFGLPFLPLRLPHTDRVIPIGIEIEVPWRAYFPDLWVEGFPNVDSETLARITAECSEREKVLLPKLMKTTECGIKAGADKYWEFAFDPVMDVSILCNQVAILMDKQLIPSGPHSLHVTFGGIALTGRAHYIAMVMESMACSSQRILSGFYQSNSFMSTGWARKGYAATFEKTGTHDLMHGYTVGVEIRLLTLPNNEHTLFNLLNVGQQLAVMVLQEQQGNTSTTWNDIVGQCRQILAEHNLPDTNWGKPHMNPTIWRSFAEQYDSIKNRIIKQIVQPLLDSSSVTHTNC